MKSQNGLLPPLATGLSARLLLLTVFFVMVSEVLIYVPSIARFRLVYLEERLDATRIATLALSAAPEEMVSDSLRRELLRSARVRAAVLRRDDRRALALSDPMPVGIDAMFDLRDDMPTGLIVDAFDAMMPRGQGSGLGGSRIIQIMGPPRDNADLFLEVTLDEAPLVHAMYDFSVRILSLSIVISLITA
jgi:hypothetical protein